MKRDMKKEKYFYCIPSSFFLFFHLFVSCLAIQTDEKKIKRYSIEKGKDLAIFLKQATTDEEETQGILPDTYWNTIQTHNIKGKFIYTYSEVTHQFFLFNRKKTFLLLSTRPLYFIELTSPLFYTHLLSQFLQIKSGRFGKKQLLKYAPFLKPLGQTWIDIYFSPKEINFATRGIGKKRIRQTGNQRPPIDIWRLIEAAKKIQAYFPQFADSKMHEDFQNQIAEGKSRKLLAREFHLPELDNIPNYAKKTNGPPFAFIIGEELELTENLLNGESLFYVNRHELVRNFIVLFSLPPGNPDGKASLNHKNSIVLLIRGDISYFKKFLQQTFVSEFPQPTDNINTFPFIISEVGNSLFRETANDYILLYNLDNIPRSLGGFFIGRDNKCNLLNGWSEYTALAPILVQAKSYILLGRNRNNLASDLTWNGSITSHYCITLTNSSFPPITLENNPQIIDSVYFTDLEDGNSYRRRGVCQDERSGFFAHDFKKIHFPSMPKNTQTRSCFSYERK